MQGGGSTGARDRLECYNVQRWANTVTAGATGEAPQGAAERVLRLIDRGAEFVVVAALIGELAVVVANVVARLALARSFLWSDEVAQFALSILAFIGGAVAYRRRDHAACAPCCSCAGAGSSAPVLPWPT